VRLPFGRRLVLVAHPDGVERVLRSGRKNYVKGSVYDGTRILLGNGLVASEGALWRRQRELANPAFRPAKFEQYLATMADCTAGLLEDWHTADHADAVDIQRAMTRLTLAIAGRTLFALDLSRHSERVSAAFCGALAAIGRRGPGGLQVPMWLPTPSNRRFRRTLRELDGMVYQIIAVLADGLPSMEQLKSLEYTSQFIHKVLRLYPPAWTVARNAVADDEIMGYRIPAGAIVMVSPYFAHRLEEFWPDPLRFNPERFTPEAIAARHPFAYFPFSLGPRICIGMQFSLHEARLVLAMLLRRFEMLSVGGDEVGARAQGTLRPDTALMLRRKPRQ
jgi:cytochrome P450